jgi:hypothetical protein
MPLDHLASRFFLGFSGLGIEVPVPGAGPLDPIEGAGPLMDLAL